MSNGSEGSGDIEPDGVGETPQEKTAQILLSEQVFAWLTDPNAKPQKL